MASNPKVVIDAIVPVASIYPPATGYHFAICEAEDVPLVDLERANWAERKPLTFMDVAICHVVFNSQPRELKATVERDHGWVKGTALAWLIKASAAEVRQTLVDLESHIIGAFKTVTEFEDKETGKKKQGQHVDGS
jgi:hypothetical protein